MAALNTRVDAQTERFALLGGSIPHTFSPQIHNSLFDARLLNAIYLPLPVHPEALPEAISVLRQSFSGFNVTIPYKEAVIPYLDELSDSASACGSVNTVVVGSGGSLVGHNTDGEGLMMALREALMPAQGIRVLMLGGGGTARVAGYELLRRSCRVDIALRSPEKGEALKEALCAGSRDAADWVRVLPLSALSSQAETYDLLLNTTPVGMYPQGEESPVPESVVERCEAVYDVIYNPPTTRLLDMANHLGIKSAGGFGMLFYQAVEAHRLWFGKVPASKALRELRKELQRLV